MATLTPKQRAFCREYIVDHNATLAYGRAGYSENGAAASASTLLRNPKVVEEIEKLEDVASKRATMLLDEIVSGVEKIAKDGEESTKDRLKAYDMLLKVQGVYTQRYEHTGKDGGPINHALDLSKLSDVELAQLRALKEKMETDAGSDD